MIDESFGWAAGDEGVIVHTSDGGMSFLTQINPVNFYTNDLFFLNRRLGWIISNEAFPGGSTIISTSNGGKTWIASDFPDSAKLLRTIYFLDSLNGYVGGFGGVICKTTDGGSSWFDAEIDTSEFSGFPVTKIGFSDPQNGFAVGGYIDVAGVIWRTTNSGLLWKADAFSPEPFYDLYSTGMNRTIAVGGDFEYGVQISTTSDGGESWIYNNLGIFGQAYSIDFRTPSEVWMATGYGSNWAISYDSGSTWTTEPVPDFEVLYGVSFSDSLHGIAVGSGGKIFRFDPGPNTYYENSSQVPHTYVTLENFPNPFNPETKIKFNLPVNGIVNLDVIDVSGKIVRTLMFNELLPEGDHTSKFDGEGIASGVYFLNLRFISSGVGNVTNVSRRIVLLR